MLVASMDTSHIAVPHPRKHPRTVIYAVREVIVGLDVATKGALPFSGRN
jgi:hypothetical protein